MPGTSWSETLERVSYLIGIYVAPHIIFPDQGQVDFWVRRANNSPLFNGTIALALMCSGRLADLAAVREHLEVEGLPPPLTDHLLLSAGTLTKGGGLMSITANTAALRATALQPESPATQGSRLAPPTSQQLILRWPRAIGFVRALIEQHMQQ